MDVRLVLGTGRDLRIRIEEQVLVVLLTQARDYLIVTADVPRISNRQSVVSLQGNQPEGGRFVDPGIRLGTGRDLRIRIEEQVLVVLLTQARDYLIVTADVPRISAV